jgi:hypothetical protein
MQVLTAFKQFVNPVLHTASVRVTPYLSNAEEFDGNRETGKSRCGGGPDYAFRANASSPETFSM